MQTLLAEPFTYMYMNKAMLSGVLVGLLCSLLSVYLMLKGWSLIGDALSHAVVPGVAGAYALHLPYSVGAFFTGAAAAEAMLLIKKFSQLREDAIIGFVLSVFFAAGLFIISLNPTSISLTSMVYGHILNIRDEDLWQIIAITVGTLSIIALKWRDLELVFFDETHAFACGLPVNGLRILFFALLTAAVVVSMQTVGAILVISLIVTPGATAYLLSDRFGRILWIAAAIGTLTSFLGVYLSYFADGATGPFIVILQSVIFLLAFLFAPKYGHIPQWLHQRDTLREKTT